MHESFDSRKEKRGSPWAILILILSANLIIIRRAKCVRVSSSGSMSLVTPCQIGITPIQRRRRVAFFQSHLSGANFVLQEEEEEEAKVTTMKRRRQKQV